ncbi:hypothetical protein MRB53_007272 [Persea americana]|uniref:Uncharacterized protein n=1 Tax=Persea americana TaxID=3435 RepID=A0ACC2MJK9_PERAE|nr:hypothetical protein MRB53_007272 [Persea americana]
MVESATVAIEWHNSTFYFRLCCFVDDVEVEGSGEIDGCQWSGAVAMMLELGDFNEMVEQAALAVGCTWGRAVEMVVIDNEGFGRGMMNGRRDMGNHANDRGSFDSDTN